MKQFTDLKSLASSTTKFTLQVKSEVCVCRGRECAGGKAQVLCSLCKGERAKRIKRQHPVLISLLPRDKKKRKKITFLYRIFAFMILHDTFVNLRGRKPGLGSERRAESTTGQAAVPV